MRASAVSLLLAGMLAMLPVVAGAQEIASDRAVSDKVDIQPADATGRTDTGATEATQLTAPDYANTPLADPALEAEAIKLMHTLRCLVCQNQSIADSNADMALDMRALVRERIAAGEKPEDIRGWLVERYGDWVSFRPPLSTATAGLWAAPFIFLLIGAFIVWRYYRKGRP